MKTETIETLKKNSLEGNKTSTGCCGGAPTSDESACCALDEQKKSEGESGCGCNTSGAASASKCC